MGRGRGLLALLLLFSCAVHRSQVRARLSELQTHPTDQATVLVTL